MTVAPKQVPEHRDYCPDSDDHFHKADLYSATPADVSAGEMVMDVACKHCGRSGAFRIPAIDW